MRLKELRLEKKLTQKQVAEFLGVGKSTYSYWENGTYEPDNDALKKLADYFGVTVDYLLKRADEPNVKNVQPFSVRKVPVFGEIACGEPIHINDREYYTVGTELDVDFALIAKGDSMIDARIFDGDLVFIRKQSSVENGEIAAIRIGDEATLKRVYYYPDKQKLVLNPANPKFEPLIYVGEELSEVEIMGKAIIFQSHVK